MSLPGYRVVNKAERDSQGSCDASGGYGGCELGSRLDGWDIKGKRHRSGRAAAQRLGYLSSLNIALMWIL